DVPEQVLGEDDAAGADERELGHPLFAPSVRPLMNCRCKATKTTIVGSATRTAAAEIRLLSVKYVPWRFCSDEVIGRLSPELINTIARRESLLIDGNSSAESGGSAG